MEEGHSGTLCGTPLSEEGMAQGQACGQVCDTVSYCCQLTMGAVPSARAACPESVDQTVPGNTPGRGRGLPCSVGAALVAVCRSVLAGQEECD